MCHSKRQLELRCASASHTHHTPHRRRASRLTTLETHTTQVSRRAARFARFELQLLSHRVSFAALRRSFRAARLRRSGREASQAPTQRGVGCRPPPENRRARRGATKPTAHAIDSRAGETQTTCTYSYFTSRVHDTRMHILPIANHTSRADAGARARNTQMESIVCATGASS